MPVKDSRLTLGLDIGSASIGWALVDVAGEKLVASGVRIFPAGADLAEFEQGRQGSSNNTARRQKRLQRRQFRRRSGRRKDLFLALQGAGLLPATPAEAAGAPGRSAARHAVIETLDKTLRHEWLPKMDAAQVVAPEQVLPYFLRARALDEPLQPFALGRALYHLGQHRGFQSNRRDVSGKGADKQKEADERSKVKTGINQLRAAMQAEGARTLGEYFARINPAAARLRTRWTARDMFQQEIERIWERQAQSNTRLTPALKSRLHQILFFQRPISAGMPGACELERGALRAPMASWYAQRFRLLQKINDLRTVAPDGSEFLVSAAERNALGAALEAEGDLTFKEIRTRRLVELPKNFAFNLQRGGEKRIPGNRTNAALTEAFGPGWLGIASPDRDRMIAQWIDPNSPGSALERAWTKLTGLTIATPIDWERLQPEDGYAKLSLKALRQLLPLMEGGMPFKTAEKEVYGERRTEPLEKLPPVNEVLPAIANPCVTRALTELRKVVNAIVREYGKPWEVRIELARDLKRNAEQRDALSRRMREQEKARKRAYAEIVKDALVTKPGAPDIAKLLLWESCGKACPYCGGTISMTQLYSDGQVEVDHILPRSRFPDDSFGNKCVAHTACNREKRGRTPYEAFSGDPQRWEEILNRVRAWKDAGKVKVFECRAEDLDLNRDDSFAARRLNETRYTTTQAARYLGVLYGGREDANGRRVIFATSGMATATLRRGWELESILGQAGPSANGQNRGKPRHDHRHHAIDAIVVALTSNAAIQQLAMAAAASAAATGSERVSSNSLRAPWVGFVDSVRPVIESMRVSHRPRHGLQGELHDATNYSRKHASEDGEYVHVRKPVHTISEKQLEKIVDPAVRHAVREKLKAVGDPKKLESDPPRLTTRTGREVPIRRVRLRAKPAAGLRAVGSGNVDDTSKHHIALFLGRDKKGRDRWLGDVVSRFVALRRQAACHCGPGERCDCVVRRRSEKDPEAEFLFSLMGGDTVEMATAPGGSATDVYVVRTISEASNGIIELDFVRISQAAEVTDLKKAGEWVRITRMNELLERACRKVTVDSLGRIRSAAG